MPGGMSIGGGGGHAQAGNVPETGPIAKCSEAPEKGNGAGCKLPVGRGIARPWTKPAGSAQKRNARCPPRQRLSMPPKPEGAGCVKAQPSGSKSGDRGSAAMLAPILVFGVTLSKFSREQCLRDLPAIR